MLMELNRSVCIDMPEADVPWFHEKYCLEQRHSCKSPLELARGFSLFFLFSKIDAPRVTTFHRDVHRCLNQLFGSEKFIKCHTHSPYYHNIGIYSILILVFYASKTTPVFLCPKCRF